eukprot:NODE_2867_length_2128_cov_18.711644.p1 GENE.NODE_2867_length_2128_cov_18.711644~~NODE_2867_length_2128_cov_18.711644.p1  ORF type:complete len:612 (+),score=138.92 NODE_2867_length_2128_cov_18.711644:101-1936(+)
MGDGNAAGKTFGKPQHLNIDRTRLATRAKEPGRTLVPAPIWVVVGGSATAGILVRTGVSLSSTQVVQRLVCGSTVQEIGLFGARLHYRLIRGTGPAEGWVSTIVQGNELLVRGNFSRGQLLLHADPTRVLSKHYSLQHELPFEPGAFATVYPAVHKATGELRAIKKLSRGTGKSNYDEHLRTELQMLIWLDHPNIVKFFEYFLEPHATYVVMELCVGGTFGDFRPDMCSDYEVAEAQWLFRDLTSALAYCHSRSVVHCDVKCRNCLIAEGTTRRQAKLIDFGLSVARKSSDAMSDWVDKILGTSFYRAPEVLEDDVGYGTKSDMWSLGVVLYVVLTDQHPFCTEGFAQPELELKTLRKGVRTEPIVEAGLPPDACDLIMKLLEINKDRRLSAADALAHEWLTPQVRSPPPFMHNHRSCESLSSLDSPARRTSMSCRSLFANASTFAVLEHFDRAIVIIVAHHAREMEVKHTRKCFQHLDSGGDGLLSKQDVRAAMKEGLQVTEEQLAHVFAALDMDDDGQIEYTEWLAATMSPSQLMSEHALLAAFSFFDTEGLGSISKNGLRSILGGHLKDRLDEYGGLSDTLTFDDFQALMHDIAHVIAQRQADARILM